MSARVSKCVREWVWVSGYESVSEWIGWLFPSCWWSKTKRSACWVHFCGLCNNRRHGGVNEWWSEWVSMSEQLWVSESMNELLLFPVKPMEQNQVGLLNHFCVLSLTLFGLHCLQLVALLAYTASGTQWKLWVVQFKVLTLFCLFTNPLESWHTYIDITLFRGVSWLWDAIVTTRWPLCKGD